MHLVRDALHEPPITPGNGVYAFRWKAGSTVHSLTPPSFLSENAWTRLKTESENDLATAKTTSDLGGHCRT
jgi:hypothetical protein